MGRDYSWRCVTRPTSSCLLLLGPRELFPACLYFTLLHSPLTSSPFIVSSTHHLLLIPSSPHPPLATTALVAAWQAESARSHGRPVRRPATEPPAGGYPCPCPPCPPCPPCAPCPPAQSSSSCASNSQLTAYARTSTFRSIPPTSLRAVVSHSLPFPFLRSNSPPPPLRP